MTCRDCVADDTFGLAALPIVFSLDSRLRSTGFSLLSSKLSPILSSFYFFAPSPLVKLPTTYMGSLARPFGQTLRDNLYHRYSVTIRTSHEPRISPVCIAMFVTHPLLFVTVPVWDCWGIRVAFPDAGGEMCGRTGPDRVNTVEIRVSPN